MELKVLLLFGLLIIIECCGLYYTKQFSLTNNYLHLGLCMLFYAIVPLILIILLKSQHSISLLNCLWNILSTIYGVAIGMFLFREHISMKQWLGIILSILAIWCLKS